MGFVGLVFLFPIMILGILERNYHSGECSRTGTPPNRRTNIIVGWVSQPCPHSWLLTAWKGWKGLCFMRFFVFLVMLHASLFVENCWLLRKNLWTRCWDNHVEWGDFGASRGCVFSLLKGDRAPPGKYWLQQSRKEKEEEEAAKKRSKVWVGWFGNMKLVS